MKTLFDAGDIDREVARVASEIERDFAGEEVLLLGVLTGAFIFLSDLCRKLKIPCEVDFIRLSSYGDKTVSCGEVACGLGQKLSCEGKNVIVVEEIVDSGRTLRFFLDSLEKSGAKKIRVCALVDKKGRREVEVPVHYAGFALDDGFLVGYGMDYAEKLRNLNRIAVIED
ncbi:hypoxanthine phosphoribosyltransferase [bacterium]|nr:MAG: hypoxanthine phosphoribosyltransferase [bacterium]